jgi:hypothetical protein
VILVVSHSYNYWSKRRKPVIVDNQADLPTGNWTTVKQAMLATGYSKTTIMMRFYKSQCDGCIVGDGPLLVNLDQIK